VTFRSRLSSFRWALAHLEHRRFRRMDEWQMGLEQRAGADGSEYVTELQKGQLDRAIRRHGVDGERSNFVRQHIATQLERRQRLDEARLLREAILESRRRTKGHDHLDTLIAESCLSANLWKSGRFEEGRSLQLHVVDRLDATRGTDDEWTVLARQNLARLYGIK